MLSESMNMNSGYRLPWFFNHPSEILKSFIPMGKIPAGGIFVAGGFRQIALQ
jgi:hypothetical protein